MTRFNLVHFTKLNTLHLHNKYSFQYNTHSVHFITLPVKLPVEY